MSNSRFILQKSSPSVMESIHCLKRRRTMMPSLLPSQRHDRCEDRLKQMKNTLLMGQRLPPQKSVVQYETADPMVSAVKQRNSERNQLDREFYYSKGGIHHKTNGDHNIKLEKDGDDGKDNNDGETNLIVVLDLDECLIHSKFLNSTDVFRQYESDRERHNTGFHNSPRKNLNSTCETFHLTLPDGELVHVHKRPNLDTFLEHVTSRYHTYIFTAAMQVYASPLLDILDPENTRFKKRFYREHCTYDPNVNAYVKDLSHVSNHISSFSNFPLDINPARRMVLVDNNPMSFIANPQNGILVSNFYDDYSDDTLSAVIDLLEELEDVDDVRPFLDEKFGLQAALSEVMNGYYWNQREDVITAMELEESHANDNEEEEEDVKRQ